MKSGFKIFWKAIHFPEISNRPNMLSDFLEKMGLTANEARTYLALLELGGVRAGNVISATGMSRATTYDALDRLVKH